jgi:hypothetical protein
MFQTGLHGVMVSNGPATVELPVFRDDMRALQLHQDADASRFNDYRYIALAATISKPGLR